MNFSVEELVVLALIIDEHPRKKRKQVHQAWMKRGVEGEFGSLYEQVVDDETKCFEYCRMSQ
jgi:hypothetical protein